MQKQPSTLWLAKLKSQHIQVKRHHVTPWVIQVLSQVKFLHQLRKADQFVFRLRSLNNSLADNKPKLHSSSYKSLVEVSLKASHNSNPLFYWIFRRNQEEQCEFIQRGYTITWMVVSGKLSRPNLYSSCYKNYWSNSLWRRVIIQIHLFYWIIRVN